MIGIKKDGGKIEQKVCIYCKKFVNTCNEPAICSRKACKKLRKK
jgi:hypothetical protein